MPEVPKTLPVSPLYHSGQINSDRPGEDRQPRLNFQENFNYNDILANVSEEQLEEITHTLQVNMVSDSIDNLSSHSSTSANNRENNCNNNNSNSNTNIVCGVVVVDERIAFNTQNNTICQPIFKNSIILGSIVLIRNTYSCEELRRSLQTQLSSVWDSNQKFSFLTKDGWPLQRNQENKVSAFNIIGPNNVILIRKTFDKPRFGICNTNGEAFGFIFVEYHWTLRQLRDAIDDHFKELGLKQKIDYTFIEKHNWPVATNQELILSVLDIVSNQTICIQSGSIRITSIAPPPPSNTIKGGFALQAVEEGSQLNTVPAIKFRGNDEISINNPQKTMEITQTDSVQPTTTGNWNKKSTKTKNNFSVSIRQTTRKRNEKVIRVTKETKLGKPIMLSYARQEAAQHALDLKQKLVERGYSVYLDVHEIQTGSDWQDSLNDAVRGCEVFVPLVTPMYGKTQWTNREVKLADLLRKFIIPINFMDSWPPECLAIQFATTQYIPWRPNESEHETQNDIKSILDIKNWSEPYISRVSNLIAGHIKEVMKALPFPEQPKAIMPSIIELDGPKDNESNKSLIVISAHPQQKPIVAKIKSLLAEEYNIWCSTDLPDGGLIEEDLAANSTPPFTPSQLPTIAEGSETSTFSDAYVNIARKIVEINKAQQRPKSMPPTTDITFEPKRPLHRLTSQTSETSHLSLTPDKIDRLKAFQEQVISAGVVIIVASETYYKSQTSRQHVYYCEHRKKTILVQCDNSVTPPWFQMLMAQDSSLTLKNPRFEELLKFRVKRTLDPQTKAPADDMHESKMQYLISFMKNNLPLLETCVYVVGSTKLQTPRSDEICKAIGIELAKVKNVNVVTSGFYGAGDIVAKSFHEARNVVCKRLDPETQEGYQCKPTDNIPNSFESSVVHIVPLKDSEDFSTKCRQNSDGSFDKVPYGKTMFLGESVKERESAVARLLDTCIIIEGGPGAAHELEEFIWNDHFVIPIISSGGAASGLYGVPAKIFDCPHGVSEQDWALLSSTDATPVEVAKAVVRIVVSLKKAIASHALSRLQVPLKAKSKLMRTRSGKKRLADRRKVNINMANTVVTGADDSDPNSPEKILPVIETMMENSVINSKKSSKWKQMQRMITFSSKKC